MENMNRDIETSEPKNEIPQKILEAATKAICDILSKKKLKKHTQTSLFGLFCWKIPKFQNLPMSSTL